MYVCDCTACTYPQEHPHLHACIHTLIHMRARMHAHTHTHTYTCMHTCTYKHTHAYMHIRVQTYKHMDTCTCQCLHTLTLTSESGGVPSGCGLVSRQHTHHSRDTIWIVPFVTLHGGCLVESNWARGDHSTIRDRFLTTACCWERSKVKAGEKQEWR